MSESKSEIVSMLVDNFKPSSELLAELSLNELTLDELAVDGELSDAWQRYHLIGDVMRDETPQALQLNLSANIAAAIADEVTILAPKSTTSAKDNDKVSAIKGKIIQLFKPIGQLAIAASAAGLMIFSVQQNTANNETVMPSQVVQTAPFAGFANPVSYNVQPSSVQEDKRAKKQAYIEQHRRFQALLSDYQQQKKLITTAKSSLTTDTNLVEKELDSVNAVQPKSKD